MKPSTRILPLASFCIVGLCLILAWIPLSHFVTYRAGYLAEDPEWASFYFRASPMVGLANFGTALVVTVAIGVLAYSVQQDRLCKRPWAIVLYGAAALPTAIVIVSFWVWPPLETKTLGHRDSLAQKQPNIESLRHWLKNETPPTGMLLPESEWPEEIRRLQPAHVHLWDATSDAGGRWKLDGNSQLQLEWGGGFGHWSLIVSADPHARPQLNPADYLVLPFGDDASVVFVHELQ